MASPYEAIKVQNLIRTYRTNPTMFDDDQLDQLEQMAKENEIDFKRTQSDFSLRRGLQQAQAGFIEGLTTLDLIPKEPRNTGEAIFRQMGHLAGFAPAILKAPVLGLAKLGMKATGKKQVGRFTQAALDGIDVMDSVAVPMIASRGTKKFFNKGLTKTGLESYEFLKEGSRTRAITEEALGLASASAISNVWKGEDAIVDSYIGGMIAGGAFGGIGNFVSVGNLYKGTPQQVDKANRVLRGTVGSLVQGLPMTLRGEPTEMQLYEYLLGGFFGYNSRPAREVAAAKWVKENRNGKEVFRPEDSKDWNSITKDSQEFIKNEHPMGYEVGGDPNVGGSSGVALGYLKRWSNDRQRTINWEARAIDHFQKNNIQFEQKDINNWYRDKAYGLYKLNQKALENAVMFKTSVFNNDQIDQMDTVQKELFSINDLSKSIFKDNKKFSSATDVGESIDKSAANSLTRGKANVEVFMAEMRRQFGNKTVNKNNRKLRGWYRSRMEQMQPNVMVEIGDKTAVYGEITKEKVGDKDVGEKFAEMPANSTVPEADFKLMTHAVKRSVDEKGNTIKEAFNIHEQRLEDGVITYRLSKKDLGLMQSAMAENNRYIVHGMKDKDFVLTSLFRDGKYTKQNIMDILSQVESMERLDRMYNRSLALEKEIYGDTPQVEKLFERKFISNVVNMAEMNNLRVEDAHWIINPKQNFGKSVADLNKRMQLFGNRMTPMVRESFANIPDMNNGQTLRIVVIDDPKNITIGGKKYKVNISDTDGLIEFRSDVLDASTSAMGQDPNITGHFKPVIAAKTGGGFFATKSNGQEAFPALNKWMKDNNIHAVVYDSSAKLVGNNPKSTLEYTDGNFNSNNLKPIEIPIEKFQISSGTYENTRKDSKGASLPLQFYGQANEQQAKGFADLYIDKVLKPSLEGSQRAKDAIQSYNKSKDIEAFRRTFVEKDMSLDEMPIEFMREVLLNRADSPMGKLISDKIMKLDIAGELDQSKYESFEPDADSAFREYHRSNEVLAKALQGTYVAKHSMGFNKNNYFNAMRKYFTKRISNPHIDTAGKSWLKGFTPEMLNYATMDPAKKSRTLKQGEIYLDNGKREMPVVFRGERSTLGEVWDIYTGEYSRGLTTKAKKEFDDAFTFLVIRTPADSMSGVRKLRLRGFTNQKGGGAFTHDKDNAYLGGADKDSDSIKIFQGIDKGVVDFYKKDSIKNERKHWTKEYEAKLDKLFEGNLTDTQRKDFMDEKFMMFSPSHRFQVARNASTGKNGLGYGLSAKIAMQNMYDYVHANGGQVNLDGLIVRLKKDAIFKTDPRIELKGADLEHYKNKIQSDFLELDSEIEWLRGGQSGKRPIFTQYYGEKGTDYKYSREQYSPKKWTPELLKIKQQVEDLTGYRFNSAVVNKYKDGKDSIGHHRDNEPDLMRRDKRGPVIASVSFGQARKFDLVSKKGKKDSFLLENGDVFLMKGDTQSNYTHGIAKDSTKNPRINITFRRTNFGRSEPRKIIKKSENVTPHRFFLDLGTKIVNVSADSSKDPNLRPYNQFRDMLFRSIFEVEQKGKSINKYADFMKAAKETPFVGIKEAIDNVKPRQFNYETDQQKSLFEYLQSIESTNNKLANAKGINTVYPKLNQMLTNMGFTPENFMFERLVSAQEGMYRASKQYYQNVGQGKFVAKDNKTSKMLAKHYNIISEELSLVSDQSKARISEVMKNNPELALDYIGKEFGQYATMELLTEQFATIQNEYAKQGRVVNTVSDVLPKIKKHAYDIKDYAQEIQRDKGRDNAMNIDLDGKIYDMMFKLSELERSSGLKDGLLQDYFSTWLLSPFRKLQNGKNQPQYDKSIHASRMIPMRAKRKFYQQMDKIYDRALTQPKIKITEANLKDSALNNNETIFKTINEVVAGKSFKGLAISKEDVAQVEKFQNTIRNHPVLSKDFNNWYMDFTSKLGKPKDATTLTMEDVRVVNNYIDNLLTNKNMKFNLTQWYEHSMTSNERMVAMNMLGTYNKIMMPVQTSKGIKYREVNQIMSPIGIIGNYFKKSEAGINKYSNRKEIDSLGMDKIMNNLTTKERDMYMDNLIKVREEGLPLDKIDPSINKDTFIKLNNELTKFNKKMYESWISTKDKSGQRFNWDQIDKEHRYGKINEYLQYDKNGKFNFKLFHDKVLNANQQTEHAIRNVGIDGVLRYRYEYMLEKNLKLYKQNNPAKKINEKVYREGKRASNRFAATGQKPYESYVHHSFKKVNEKTKLDQLKWLRSQPKEEQPLLARKLQQENEFINPEDFIDIDPKTSEHNVYNFGEDVAGKGTRIGAQRIRSRDIPFKRSYDLVKDYQEDLISGYYRNLMKFKAQNEIDVMMHNMKSYKPNATEKAYFKDLYKGVSKKAIPDKLRYNSYVDVWADFVKRYAEDSLGYQSRFSERMMTPQGKQLLHLNKKNMYYNFSDAQMIKQFEKLYQSKLGKKHSIPLFDKNAIPKDKKAREEYFAKKIHQIGRLEAQYELLTLLANTGTWTTNIFGGATMTIGSAGVKNYANSFNNDRVYRTLLSDANGNATLKLLNGAKVKNRKDLMTYLEERGVIDNFIQNEFEHNTRMTSKLKNKGVNLKDFKRDLLKAMTSKKGNRDESVIDVTRKYGVKDEMIKYGGFLMKQSERVNRLNAFIAHGMQAVEGFGEAGRSLSLKDPYIFQQAERGIEMTQFLYQNSFRPAFMRTATGKVLGRFKLFAFNSVRIRKEFYRQAKLQGFKEGTEAYNRFKNTWAIDLWMYALGSAFMFSLFDTTLPPPFDWVQAMADWTFGDRKEKDMAFFGSPLGPLNILKPPIARVPEAMGELLTGQYKDFTNYTAYTMFPFGRGVRQLKQLADDRPKRGLERAPEILFRFPYHQIMNRIERNKRENRQLEDIQNYLD